MGIKSLLLKTADTLNLYPIFNRYTKNTATVFMLHSITPSGSDREGAISADNLARHFEYLKKKDYRVLSLRNYVNAIINQESTHKAVVFTVDDGYRDFYLNAFDVFKEYDYPATIFITSDFIEKKLFFWWDAIEYAFQASASAQIDLKKTGLGEIDISTPQLKAKAAEAVTLYCKTIPNRDKLSFISELVNSLGVDISGQPLGIYEPLSWDEIREMHSHKIDFMPHTKTHPILSKIPPEEQVNELHEPKRVIEEKLGGKANIFCYPNGRPEDFTEETVAILKSSGYVAAVMGIAGFDNTQESPDLFRLRRYVIPVEGPVFKQYVSGLENFKSRILR